MSISRLVVGLIATASLVGAQASKIPVRQLPAPAASTPAQFTALNSIRHLSNGKVLVADQSKRLVWMYDANLQNPVIVIDSVAGKENSWGSSPLATLIPFGADSTLFVDRSANIFVVLGPDGKVGRVMPLPPGSASTYLASPTYGPGYSTAFGVVFRGPASLAAMLKANAAPPVPGDAAGRATLEVRGLAMGGMAGMCGTIPGGTPPGPNDPPVTYKSDDTSFVFSMDAKTRALEPLTSYISSQSVTTCSPGMFSRTTGGGLYPVFDQWALAADGSIAILRTREYRLDFFNTDRTVTPGPRLPFDWKKNDDNEKQRLVDSVNAARRKLYDERLVQRVKDSTTVANGGTITPPAAGRGGGGAAGAGDVAMTAVAVTSAAMGGRGATPPPSGAVRMVIGPDGQVMSVPGALPPLPPPPPVVDVSEIPDYMPAVFSSSGSFFGDADNNFWIRTRPGGSIAGSPTFDIVNRKGELIDRVQLPEGRTVVGFGKGGFVYAVGRDAGMAKLEKIKVR